MNKYKYSRPNDMGIFLPGSRSSGRPCTAAGLSWALRLARVRCPEWGEAVERCRLRPATPATHTRSSAEASVSRRTPTASWSHSTYKPDQSEHDPCQYSLRNNPRWKRPSLRWTLRSRAYSEEIAGNPRARSDTRHAYTTLEPIAHQLSRNCSRLDNRRGDHTEGLRRDFLISSFEQWSNNKSNISWALLWY